MRMTRFADFEVWIDSTTLPLASNTPTIFPVQVFSSPAGPATGELTLPITGTDFQTKLVQVRSIDPNLELRKSFGKQLFEALFIGKVRDAWVASRGRVNAGEADGLRLRLWINVPEVAALPWELLWDEQSNNFLATSADLVVSRYLPVPEPPVLLSEGPLRILLMVEGPPGPPVVEQEEVERIETALHTLGETVFVQVRSNLKMAEIEQALQQNYHVLHFLGHGTDGKLIVTGDNDQAIRIDDQAFAQVVQGRRSLRLVVLNACHSSQVDQAGLFGGVGPALIQKGLPAVIAMQYPFVQLDTASRFSEAFYGALANGLPVDVAVNAGRRVLSAGPLLDSRDWSTPVLYMGTRSGHILGFLDKENNEVEQAWHRVQAAAQESDESKAALTELAQSFQDLASRHQQLETLMTLERHLRDTRTDFELCTEVVERAKGDWRKLQSSALSRTWQRVQQNQVDPLRVFVKSHPNVDTTAWFPEVEQQTAAIDADLVRGALGPLITSVSAYGNQLAQAEAYVHQQFDKALADLMMFSARTLGRLDMP
jgi:CHAT domain